MINSTSQKHSFLHRAFQRRKIWGVRPIWKKSTRWSRHLQVVGYAIGDFKRIWMAAELFISGANSGRRRSFRQGWEFYWKWRAGKLLREPAGEESREQSQILERLENQDNYSFVFCSPPPHWLSGHSCVWDDPPQCQETALLQDSLFSLLPQLGHWDLTIQRGYAQLVAFGARCLLLILLGLRLNPSSFCAPPKRTGL